MLYAYGGPCALCVRVVYMYSVMAVLLCYGGPHMLCHGGPHVLCHGGPHVLCHGGPHVLCHGGPHVSCHGGPHVLWWFSCVMVVTTTDLETTKSICMITTMPSPCFPWEHLAPLLSLHCPQIRITTEYIYTSKYVYTPSFL